MAGWGGIEGLLALLVMDLENQVVITYWFWQQIWGKTGLVSYVFKMILLRSL